MVTILNDMNDFCCLDLKYSAMFCFNNFLLDLCSFCWWNKVFSSNMFDFICDPLYGLARQLRYECHRKCMRWDSLTFTYYHIIYCILQSTIIIVLAIMFWLPAVDYYHKALHLGCCSSSRSASGVGFSKFRQTLSNIFAMNYGDIKD